MFSQTFSYTLEDIHANLFEGRSSPEFPISDFKKREAKKYLPNVTGDLLPPVGEGKYSSRIAIYSGSLTDIAIEKKGAIATSNNGDLFMGSGKVGTSIIHAAGAGLQKELYDTFGVSEVDQPMQYGCTYYQTMEGRGFSITCNPHDMKKTHNMSRIEVLIPTMEDEYGIKNMYYTAFSHSHNLDYLVIPAAGMTHPVLENDFDKNARLTVEAFIQFTQDYPHSRLKVIIAIVDGLEAENSYKKHILSQDNNKTFYKLETKVNLINDILASVTLCQDHSSQQKIKIDLEETFKKLYDIFLSENIDYDGESYPHYFLTYGIKHNKTAELIAKIFTNVQYADVGIKNFSEKKLLIDDKYDNAYGHFLRSIAKKIDSNASSYDEETVALIRKYFYTLEEGLKISFPKIYNEILQKYIGNKDSFNEIKEAKEVKEVKDAQEIKEVKAKEVKEIKEAKETKAVFPPPLNEEFREWANNAISYFDPARVHPARPWFACTMIKVALIPHVFKEFFPLATPSLIDITKKAMLFLDTGLNIPLKLTDQEALAMREDYTNGLSSLYFENFATRKKVNPEIIRLGLLLIKKDYEKLSVTPEYLSAFFAMCIAEFLVTNEEEISNTVIKKWNFSQQKVDKLQQTARLFKIWTQYNNFSEKNYLNESIFEKANTSVDAYFHPNEFSELFTYVPFNLSPIHPNFYFKKTRFTTQKKNRMIYKLFGSLKENGLQMNDRSVDEITKNLYCFTKSHLERWEATYGEGIYSEGPAIKNYATRELEKILRDLCASTHGKISAIEGKITHLNKGFYVFNHKIYNLDELIPAVNFDEIEFIPSQLSVLKKLYFSFEDEDDIQEKLYSLNEEGYPEIKKAEVCKSDILSTVGFQTIEQYKDELVGIVQAFLRNPSRAHLTNLALIYTIFQISAAAKILRTPSKILLERKLPESYVEKDQLLFRLEKLDNENFEKVLLNRTKCFEEKKVERLSAFTSTSGSLTGLINFFSDDPDIFVKYGAVVTIILQNLTNPIARKLGNDSQLSQSNQENEFLIPPGGQLIYFHYIKKKNLHFFFAKPVNIEQQSMYTIEAEKKLNDACQQVEYHILSLLKKHDMMLPLDMKPIKLLMQDKFLLFKSIPDEWNNNLLHTFAKYFVSIKDCASVFTIECFLELLFQKNSEQVTPLERFFWTNESKSNEIILWLCKDFYLKLIPQQKRCFNNYIQAELLDARRRGNDVFADFLGSFTTRKFITNFSLSNSNDSFLKNSRKRPISSDSIVQFSAKKLHSL